MLLMSTGSAIFAPYATAPCELRWNNIALPAVAGGVPYALSAGERERLTRTEPEWFSAYNDIAELVLISI